MSAGTRMDEVKIRLHVNCCKWNGRSLNNLTREIYRCYGYRLEVAKLILDELRKIRRAEQRD